MCGWRATCVPILDLNVDRLSFGQRALDRRDLGANPRSIGLDQGLFGEDESAYQNYNSQNASYSSDASKNIKQIGNGYVLFPIGAFFGAVLFLVGLFASNYGIDKMMFRLHVGGWLIMVVGGIIFGASMIGYALLTDLLP